MPDLAVDAAWVVVTAVVAIVLLLVAEEPDRHAPDAVGMLLLAAASAPLLVRRRWPAAAAAVTGAIAVGYLLLAYPGGPVTVPVLVAIYGAGAFGGRAAALLLVVFFAGIGTVHRLLAQQEAVTVVAFQGLLFVFAWLVGELVRSRRELRAEVATRLRRAAEERDGEAQRRVQQERLRIARELHDVMAHTVSSMTVQAGVAADLLTDRPHEAQAALQAIRRSGRDAMAEIRATVTLLRGGGEGEPPQPPAPRLADLDALVDRAGGDGPSVERVTVGDPRPLPAAVELTAYRIVQEALTNVVRHAGARTATVTLRYQPDTVVVEVTDDGRGSSHVHPGFGLLGMRERAEAVGGRLETGPVADGGFRVRAHLPAGEDAT